MRSLHYRCYPSYGSDECPWVKHATKKLRSERWQAAFHHDSKLAFCNGLDEGSQDLFLVQNRLIEYEQRPFLTATYDVGRPLHSCTVRNGPCWNSRDNEHRRVDVSAQNRWWSKGRSVPRRAVAASTSASDMWCAPLGRLRGMSELAINQWSHSIAIALLLVCVAKLSF